VTRRLSLIAGWLIAGHAAAAGLLWSLLQVPESSSLMLAISGTLLLLAALALAWTVGGALAAWRPESTPGRAMARGLGHVAAIVLGMLVFALVWWLTEKAALWHAQYGGQLDAWIIARTGKSETARLHTAIFWLLWFARWGLGLTIALSLAAWMVRDGLRTLGSARWLASALHPLRWLGVTALVGLGIALPWHHVYWRPEKMSVGAEPWFVAAKLAAIALLATVAWALTLRVVTPPANQP
jgi:hypothetical protein